MFHVEQMKISIEVFHVEHFFIFMDIKSKILALPNKPGVYQYFDDNGNVIYIGKAKDLKKRVASYFNQSKADTYKLKLLVSKISDIKHIVVESESDALLLENNLIKKYQPKYNVQLKDDKSFPWICIKNEHFPRVFSTRNIMNDGSEYFGPYTSAKMVRTLLSLIKQLYQLRTCNYNLTKENIIAQKFKVCLEYHIGNCKGPCENLQSEPDYNEAIKNVRNIIKGNLQEVIHYLQETMRKFSAELKFEEAQRLKERIEILERYKSKSTIVNPAIKELEVYAAAEDQKTVFVNFLKIINGAIIQAHTIEIIKKLNENIEQILPLAILDIRSKTRSNLKEILVPFNIEFPFDNIKVTIPKIGDKKKLIDLSERNARYHLYEKKKQVELSKVKSKSNVILNAIKEDLKLQKLPVHIECFDNSNIQGSHPVASCVVFKNGKPAKSHYRHYNIKSVVGANDFASMQEVVYRRYNRLREEGSPLPQLVVIDGGKGQLNAAMESIKNLELDKEIALIGIAKKLEEIFFYGDSVPLYLDKNSPSLKVIQQLRNEAHRFAISFHRNKRSSTAISSELEKIKGVGDKTKEILLKQLGSVKNIKETNLESLTKMVGKAKAKIVYNYFHT
jgi:excinuclease ABC subunit C